MANTSLCDMMGGAELFLGVLQEPNSLPIAFSALLEVPHIK